MPGTPFRNTSLFGVLLWLHLVLWCEVSAERLARRLVPRAPSELINLPIHALKTRSPADNTTFGAGLNAVSLSKDKQSYFTLIKVGNFNFRVDLDTGSADLWLVSNTCQTETCKSVPRYPLDHESASFTVLNDNTTAFEAHYADGTFASGFVARETIAFSNLTLANQVFGVVTNSNVSLTDQASGLMGLGFPRLSSISGVVANSSSFFATLASQGLLEYPLFALSLAKNSTGSLTIGAIDSSIVANASDIHWNKVAQFPPIGAENNVSSYLQWSIPITGIAVNGTQLLPIPTYPRADQPGSLALFDVGTSGIYGSYQDVTRIYAMIDGARLVDSGGQWAVPCDTTVPMHFTFGLQNYTLLPTDYMIGPADGNPNLCLSWPAALPPSSDGIDWQMGTTFLRTVYSIFNFGINGKEPPLIGLYPLQNSTNITDTTQSPDTIQSFFSANSATVATTLPNFILPTPTFTTPPYALNTSVSASVGGLVSSGLANSTYSALFGEKTTLTNASAIPTISPQPSAVTLILTDSSGSVSTSVLIRATQPVTLGLPSSDTTLPVPRFRAVVVPCVIFAWTLLLSL